jgi:arginyl-tRNA synthetase
MLKKADGSTLYLTRDLAGLIYRWETFHFHESLYVVGVAQADYFKQALRVIEMMEQAEGLPVEDRMTGRVKHIGFGWVRFENKTLSTRRGQTIFLEDVIDEAVGLARAKIKEKNPELAAVDETAHIIGVGAVLFSQLSVRRLKDINFVWEEVLNFEGETGPYLQYTHARLRSLLRHYGKEATADIDYALLDREEENRVVELLADFPEAIEDASRNYDPYYIAAHLLRLGGAFNKVYQRKDRNGRIDKIVSDNAELSEARIALVKAVQIVIREGLYLLGLRAPEEM